MKGKGKGKRKENDEGGDDHKDKDDGRVSIILSVNLHCKSCANRVIRSIKRLKGVEEAAVDETNTMLSITGKAGLDPHELLLKVEAKTRRKASLLSFEKHEETIDETKGSGGEEEERAQEEKVDVEARGKLVVLKMGLHCEGCMEKAKERLLGVDGVERVELDLERNATVVKGTMDVESMLKYLEGELARKVEIVAMFADGCSEEEVKEEGKDSNGGAGEEEKKSVASEKKVEEQAKKRRNEEGVKKDVKKYVKDEKESMKEFVRRENVGEEDDRRHRYVGGNRDVYTPYGYPVGIGYAPRPYSDESIDACSIL